MPGVFVVPMRRTQGIRAIGLVVKALLLVAGAGLEGEYEGTVDYLPL